MDTHKSKSWGERLEDEFLDTHKSPPEAIFWTPMNPLLRPLGFRTWAYPEFVGVQN